jgi:hypothetical protein
MYNIVGFFCVVKKREQMTRSPLFPDDFFKRMTVSKSLPEVDDW